MAVLGVPTSLCITDNPGQAPGTAPRNRGTQRLEHSFSQSLGTWEQCHQVCVHVKTGEALVKSRGPSTRAELAWRSRAPLKPEICQHPSKVPFWLRGPSLFQFLQVKST